MPALRWFRGLPDPVRLTLEISVALLFIASQLLVLIGTEQSTRSDRAAHSAAHDAQVAAAAAQRAATQAKVLAQCLRGVTDARSNATARDVHAIAGVIIALDRFEKVVLPPAKRSVPQYRAASLQLTRATHAALATFRKDDLIRQNFNPLGCN
jgi:hypothetical protein